MKKLKAFTLLEISFSLVLVGTILTGVFGLYKIVLISQKNHINQKKYHYIQYALQNHVIQHGRLPFAAQENNGIETKNCTKGFIPYKSLGIHNSYAKNSNNQDLIYQANSYLCDTNIPIIMPLNYYPKEGETSFNRIYKMQDNEIILYDMIAHIPDEIIIIDKNNKSVILDDDFFYILPPIEIFKNLDALYNWSSSWDSKEDKFKCKNTIAWAILNNNEYVFYQARFNLSAQIEFYASPEPLYLN